MQKVVNSIRQALKRQGDSHTRTTGQSFFKERVKIYGVRAALVTKIAKGFNQEILAMNKEQVFALCEELWQSGYMEESFVACHFSYLIRKTFVPRDFAIFAKWVSSYVSNWASCDTFCNHTMGTFIEMYPDYLNSLKKWTKSQNRWVRRASAVSLIIPAKQGKFLPDILEIADILLTDSDDLVQKGYGWLLKAASQAHQNQVFAYVVKNKAKMPRTALRYAIEKMPAALRKLAMVK